MTNRRVFNEASFHFSKDSEVFSSNATLASTSIILPDLFPVSATFPCVNGLSSDLHQSELYDRGVSTSLPI